MSYRNNKNYKRNYLRNERVRRNVNEIHVNNRRNKNRRRRNQTNGSYDIGQIKNAPVLTRCIRYESPGLASAFEFRNSDVMQMMGFATTTTAGYSIMQAVRIKRVKVICMPDTSEVSGSCRFEWLGTNAPENEDTMVYMPAVPCSKNHYPPEGSTSWFWRSDHTSSEAMFAVNFSANIVFFLDIEFEFVLKNDTTSQALSTLTGATANNMVYPCLPFNIGTKANRLIPVGLPNG